MKKTTKGAIAAGSAALLLAGGAGTMAAWNASANLGGGKVTAGSMTVAQDGTGTWTWGATGAGASFDPVNERLVPGDKVSYAAKVDYTLVGKNLTAKLTPTLAGVDGNLANYLTVTPANATAAPITTSGSTNFVTVIEFDAAKLPTGENTAGATESADLSGASVLLEQTISGS